MSMKAVIFQGAFDIVVQDRPKPQLADPNDAIVRVKLAGICGSELHMYRGHQTTATGHIMGHEFVGVVEQVGSNVTRFKPGDQIVSIFSTVCMKCWFCKQGLTNRCIHGAAFGTQLLPGGQAEYVRVPFADGTLQHFPRSLDQRLLIMMCDIFPTGYYGACRAIEGLQNQYESRLTSFPNGETRPTLAKSVVAIIGCGPVGICALATARSKGLGTVIAIDSVEDRLQEAESLGAISIMIGRDDVPSRVMALTDGRGTDAVVEVVGNNAALRSAFDLLRPCGILSSVGFHQGELPFTALECYQKNITVNFGRVPVRTVFEDSLQCLQENQDQLMSYFTHEFKLMEAGEGYRVFEEQKARKAILRVGD